MLFLRNRINIDDFDGHWKLGLVVHAFIDLSETAFSYFFINVVFTNTGVAYIVGHGFELRIGKIQAMALHGFLHKFS